jgi:hypothetical protein
MKRISFGLRKPKSVVAKVIRLLNGTPENKSPWFSRYKPEELAPISWPSAKANEL